MPGPLGIFRRDAVVAAGGYSTATFAEDCDLTLQLLGDGWKIKYEPRAVAYTEAPEHLIPLLKQRYRWTRGILQALGKRAGWLLQPGRSVVVWLSLFIMLFEAILWPVVNVLGNLLFVVATLNAGSAAGVASRRSVAMVRMKVESKANRPRWAEGLAPGRSSADSLPSHTRTRP